MDDFSEDFDSLEPEAEDAAKQFSDLMLGEPESLIEDAREFARLSKLRRDLESKTEDIKAKQHVIEERLTEAFINAGVKQVKVDGATVHIRKETWPALVVPEGMTKDEARAGAVDALVRSGHGSYITYNNQSVRSLVTELAKLDPEGKLPPGLGDWLRAEVKYRIGVRGGK